MGYICPDCGEGLPADTPCPCTMAGGDLLPVTEAHRLMMWLHMTRTTKPWVSPSGSGPALPARV